MSELKAPNVAKAGAIMMISLLLSRVLGLIRESIATGQFGVSAETDAYVLSFQIPDLLFFLVAGGALSAAFIPIFTEYLHTKGEEEAWELFSNVATIMTVFVTGLILIAWVAAPQITSLIAPTKSPEVQAMVTYMSRIVLPSQLAFFIGGLMMGTLYARQIFTVPGLGPNIYNIGIITGALVVSQFVTPSVSGMSWGALVGAFIGNIFVPLLAIRALGARYRFTMNFRHEGVRRVFKLMAPVVLGLSLPGVFGILLQYFGGFFSDGVNTALNLSNRLMQAPLAIFGQSLAIGVFPALAQFYATQRMDMFRDQLGRTLRLTLFLATPFATIMVVAPADIIRLMYEHGEFTAENTALTAPVLAAFALGIAAWCVQPVIMRAYFALQRPVPPIIMGTIATAIFLGVSYGVVSSKSNYTLLPLAGSAAAIALAIILIIMIRRDVDGLDIGGLIKTFALSVLASFGAAGVFWCGMRGLDFIGFTRNKIGVIVGCLVFGFLAAGIYYLLSRALKMPESDYLDRALNKRKGGGSGPSNPPPATPAAE